jgi:cysteine-rich repeat protein/YVTN family beta-propeller protein
MDRSSTIPSHSSQHIAEHTSASASSSGHTTCTLGDNVRHPIFFQKAFFIRTSLLGIAVLSVVVAASVYRIPLCFAAPCTITVGSSPRSSVISGTGVYVINFGGASISLIDTDTNTVERTITVGNSPQAIATSGTGVFTANAGGTVSIVDKNRFTAKTVTVGTNPSGLVVSGTGLYVMNRGSNNISIIDTRLEAVVATVSASTGPYSGGVSGTGVYIANISGTTVTVIDTVRRTSTNVTVGSTPVYIAVSGTGVYTANANSHTISVIDTRTNTKVKDIPVGSFPEFIAASGTGVYVANYDGGTVSVINTNGNTVIKTITTGSRPYFIGFSATGAYVPNFSSATLSVINTRSLVNMADISVGTNPQHIAFFGNSGYVTNNGSNNVTVISVNGNALFNSCTPVVCGNGSVGEFETCDDGNTANGDGCTSSCLIEPTFSCSGTPSLCTQACGSGVALGAASSYHYGSTCYAYYTTTTRNYSDAESACVALGGHLATVNSSAVQSVLQLMGSFAWIGLTDAVSENVFRWLDGTTLSYTNWAGGQPNGGAGENCAYLENAYLWHDYPCAEAHQYFCQIRDGAVPPSATTGGGGMAAWLMQLRQQNNLNYLGQSVSSSSSSAVSETSATPSLMSTAIPSRAQTSGGGGMAMSSSSSSSSSSSVQPVAKKSALQLRTCARVMKWMKNDVHALGRLNTRLQKLFGFTCGGW